jgi:hypothetical protein
MNKVKFYKEEFDTNISEIAEAESLYDRNFPEEYKQFLLRNNGGISYPSFPTIATHKGFALWDIEMFHSVGYIIVRKHQINNSEYPEHEEYELDKYGLKNENLLSFALGERGWYFMDLSIEEKGQLYFCNYSDGDGIVKIETNSFNKFLESLGFSEWSEIEYNPNFEFSTIHYSSNKIFRHHLFSTPFDPSIGVKHFSKVFKFFGNKQPQENGYLNVIQQYVYDREKLDFLLDQGCSTEGLLLRAYTFDSIKYLVNELNLDINESIDGRYPLQNYLSPSSTADVKNKYELIHKLLDSKIDINWSVKGKLYNGEPDVPVLEKLMNLNKQYWDYEKSDKDWWIKNGRPSGHIPFIRSEHIDRMLGIKKNTNWVDKLLDRITRGNIR